MSTQIKEIRSGFGIRPAYNRHLSLKDQHQIRFGYSYKNEEDTENVNEKTSVKKSEIKSATKINTTLKDSLKERIKKKKMEKKSENKNEKKTHETKSVKKTESNKNEFSRSASKTKQSLKKSAKNKSFTKTPKPKKDDDVLLIDKEGDLLDETKDDKIRLKMESENQKKSREQEIQEFKKFSTTIRNNIDRGYKHHVSSGIYDPRDKRKGGYFMRNSCVAFENFG